MRFRKVHELAPREAIASNEGWAAHQLETQDVEEATNDNLAWADAIIFGTSTRYGLPTAQLKQFLDMTGGLWVKGALVNKVCSSFTCTDTSHGGQETTIITLNTTFYNWGAYSANLEEGESFTTLELKINFLKPIWKARLLATGREVKQGRTLGLVECDITDEKVNLVARATSTCMTLRGEQAQGR